MRWMGVRFVSVSNSVAENEKKQKITADMTMEERWECYRSTIAELTIMSDIFARNVLKEKNCTEYLLETILGEEKVTVLEQVLQMDYKNLQGRSAILDCVARDRKNRIVNIEIQNEGEGASPERARYHSGLLDMNTLKARQDFEELPEKYVIFITRDDTMKMNLPIYNIRRKIVNTGKSFEDKECILYVNAKIQDDTRLGKLMHDLHCKKADEMYSKVLADRVRILKETPEGVKLMCKEMDEIYNWGVKNGEQRGEQSGEKRSMKLIDELISSGRMEDCQKVTKDAEYRRLLMREFGI